MGVKGKMVSQTEIKSDRDTFYDLFRMRPYMIPEMASRSIHNCGLQTGQWGFVGAVIVWNLFYGGKNRVARDLIEEVDTDKRSVTFVVLDGDVREVYKSFRKTIRVDDKLVTWTLEYEKASESVPEPNLQMDFLLNATRDVDAGIGKQLGHVPAVLL